MAKKSIGEVNLMLTANAQQLSQTLKRADSEIAAWGQKMDRELGRMQRNLGAKFSLSDIGKDFARGLGIGSGFSAAQMVADKIVDHWAKAAEAAKSIEESTARQLEHVESMIRLRQSDDQRIAAIDKELARMEGQRLALLALSKAQSIPKSGGNAVSVAGVVVPNVYEQTEIWPAARKALDDAHKVGAEMQKLSLEREQLARKVAEGQVKAAADGYALVEQIDKANAEVLRRSAQGLAADRQRIAEEELKYQIELHQAELAATAARDKRLEESTEQRMKRLQELVFAESEAAMENFKPAIEEFESEMAMMWSTVSDRAGQAFADMVLTGRASFASIAEMATRAVLEIAARMAIINPLLNAVFGGMGGWQALPAFSFGGGRALGGPVSPGTAYTVGERGRELFVPDTPGRIVSAGQTAAALGGAPVYNFTYNFASGVQRAEIMPLLRASERSTIARIAEAQRRGAPISAAI